jgi:subfamily B ATP-binding cassette protein MsbA
MFVIQGDLTAGGLIAFFAYVDKLRSPVAALVQAFPAITEGSIALQRIFEFLRLPVAIRDKDRAVAFGPLKGSIQFDKVTFGYEERRKVLRDVSFTLRAGQTYAFVGESGGGKSTILQLLLRLYDVSQGEVRLDGVNIKDYALSSLRQHMGIVTQDNFLYSTSIMDNIKLAKPEATDEEAVAAARKAYAHDFIEGLPGGYETEIGERGIKLSGGQKQRIALARVFLKDPSVIILDEATSALDNESEQLVQQSIHQLANDKTVIMIAHRLSTIVHADTIFVVKDGKIAESGSHQSLLALGGYYKELFAKQQLPMSASSTHAPALKLASGQA